MFQLQFNPMSPTRKAQQIVDSIVADIERGVLKNGERLPSIFKLCTEYEVGRDSVVQAYDMLKAQHLCKSVQGSGYFVQAREVKKVRVLLIFNKLSSYKRLVYDAFWAAAGERAEVDLQVHHYSTARLQEILQQSVGKYNYYVLMPHFTSDKQQPDLQEVLKLIPTEQLVLLDKDLPDYRGTCLRVFQDFHRDIFRALEGLRDALGKYQRLVLITPDSSNGYLAEIAWGFRAFCLQYSLAFAIQTTSGRETPSIGTAYVVMDTADLALLLKELRASSYAVGQQVGVVSFNETPLKELLDITVITTDFEAMGRTTAELLLEKKRVTVKNPFHLIRRGSL